jgi:hypothetical protein
MTDTATKKRIGPLKDMGGVIREIAKIYREARRSELETGEATKLVMVLRELRCCFEIRDIEQRLKALEGRGNGSN